jgi:hypothetical protein
MEIKEDSPQKSTKGTQKAQKRYFVLFCGESSQERGAPSMVMIDLPCLLVSNRLCYHI